MELIPERDGGEALQMASGPVPLREVQVCSFIVQQMCFWVDDKATRACRFTGGLWVSLHCVCVCHCGWLWWQLLKFKHPFLWKREREAVIDSAAGCVDPCCLQSLLMAALHPHAV